MNFAWYRLNIASNCCGSLCGASSLFTKLLKLYTQQNKAQTIWAIKLKRKKNKVEENMGLIYVLCKFDKILCRELDRIVDMCQNVLP